MRIDVYTHNFAISEMTAREKEIVYEFIQPLIIYSYERQRGGRFKRVPVRLYGAAFKDRTQFRFHINQLDEFKAVYLKYYKTLDFIQFNEHEFEPSNFPIVEHVYKKEIVPYDNQIPFIDKILSLNVRNMLSLRTGGGKTIIALYCIHKLQTRGLLTFKKGFVERWKDEIFETFVLEPEDVVEVQGTAHFIAIQELALIGEFEAKFIIITTRTYQKYLEAYEKNSGDPSPYPIPPHELHEVLGIGFHVKDEFHMEHHLNHHIELYTSCPKTLALSATMTPSDPNLDMMYRIAYPIHERMVGAGGEPFIVVTALFYRFHKPGIVKYKGAKGYSHIAFEQSLISKKSSILPNYIKMVYDVVKRRFIDIKNPKETCIVFCATVDLCVIMLDHFKKKHPELNVTKYTEEDDYQKDLIDGELVFSTVLSAGTAVDKPLLRFVLMTTAINSRQSNEQAKGRPRELWKYDDRYKTDPVLKEVRPEFAYLVNADIDKHVQYHEAKVEFFRGGVLKHQNISLPHVV